jgi:hypothetical protein
MSITAFSGPVVSYGVTMSSTSGDGITGQDFEHNPQRSPSFSDLGDAMMDPRAAYSYDPGQGSAVPVLGFYNNVGTVDYVPTTLNASAFVSATTVATGVSGAFTLNAASSSGGTYSTTIVAPETGKASSTLIAIDSTAAYLTFGSAATMCVWNPGAGTGRNVTIKLSSNADGGSYTVLGRDMYGFKMSETIATGSTNLAGRKAFKYISAIYNCSTPTSTGISIGFGDVYGFPLAVPYVGLNSLVSLNSSANNSSITNLSTTTVVLASTVATQTSTTPDVRGTYASSTASNGVIRLQMQVTPAASAAAAMTSTNFAPFFGGTQYSSV